MIVLALDTTGADCSVALTRGDDVLAHISERLGRGHAERLAPMVLEALDAADLTAADIDRLAVCTGPGSFTGLRVALSYAKGFALPRRLPIVGVDALRLRAEESCAAGDRLCGVFRDVRRGEVFFSLYSHGEPLDGPPRAVTLAEAETASHELQVALYEATGADMRVMGRLAASLDPAAYPADPLYARAPDAKLPGGVSLPT